MSLLRIFAVDFYMSPPIPELDVTYSDFRGSCIHHVPIIRIFGSSEKGEKTCLHIHGVFPYLYIPFEGAEHPNAVMYQVAAKLDQAINTALGHATSTTQHIFRILSVAGIPFYGYHNKPHQFLKVYFYNPLIMKKASNLLYTTNIFGKVYQPHEVHIPFVVQFMIDYNLHGMNFISLSEVRYRGNFECSQTQPSPEHVLPKSIAKISTCSVEIDGLAEHIVNRYELLSGGNVKNPGIAALWEDEKQRLRNKGEGSQITPCLTQNRVNVAPSDSHNSFSKILQEKLSSKDIQKQKVNQDMVYPAPTPRLQNMLNASCIQQHYSKNSASLSDNTIFDDTQDLGDQTLTLNNTLDASQFCDVDAKDLMKVLHDLGDKAEVEEEDCILSQVAKADESDEEVDMSLPLGSATTPVKIQNEQNSSQRKGEVQDLHTAIQSGLEQAKRKLSFLDITLPATPPDLKKRKTLTMSDDSSKFALDVINTSKTIKGELNKCSYNVEHSSEELYFEGLHLDSETNTFIDTDDKALLKAKAYDKSNNYVSVPGCSKTNVYSKDFPSSGSDSLTPNLQCSGQSANSDFKSDYSFCTNPFDLTQNLSMLELHDIGNETICLEGSKVLMPKYNPPSREMILKSLDEYSIPAIRYQEPFYSDVKHVASEMLVGNDTLRITTKTSHLLEFDSCVTNRLSDLQKAAIQELHPNIELSSSKLKSLKLSFGKNSRCYMTTLKVPPSRTEVENWLKCQKEKRANVEEVAVVNTRLKIQMPRSPGALSDSDSGDDSLSLSLSPQVSQEFNKKRTNLGQKALKNSVRSKTFLQSQLNKFNKASDDSYQIMGATLDNTHGFKMSFENLQKARAVSQHQYLTIVSMELHVKTRGEFKPNPQVDPIRAVFYTLFHDVPDSSKVTGVFVVDPKKALLNGCSVDRVKYVDSELELITELTDSLRAWDPDILVGYEIELLSWGYLIERGYVLGVNLRNTLGRTQVKINFSDDEQGEVKLPGRVLLDAWRLMKSEIALQSYTFENIMYHVLHQRIPLYSFKDLSFWWEHNTSLYRHRTVSFYVCRVEGILKLFEQLDFVSTTSELARLFGIQFYEVLSRGSQFRVESMMLRLAKPLNYVAVSPSVQQRAKMKAPEWIPLVMEPQSKFYVDPVIVLDFQSLYPSMMIAYNYCFSTCLGKINVLGQDEPFEFGTTQLQVSSRRLKMLLHKNLINFSPCGVAFVKPKVREGILPQMLMEILETRLMVKKSMKQNKDDKILQRVLHSRQLGLKLIANVTYGYTAANFSGRMPAVELGDSVVSKGRETLLRAITLIESTPHWGAKVVYGDTDSIFVLVRGRSLKAAFEIGQEIANAVTNDNPSPVKLKLEKVFQPCILQTKKRYVGNMYESSEQTEPEFLAKGIETVRRDGCPAVSKMLEKCLKILFDTRDVSLVRTYVERQFSKLLSGRFNLQDLIFAKEYRGASKYRPGACVPALELARKWIAVDKRNEPRNGERVPYVIVNGPPGLPLIRLVRSPRELLGDSNLIPNVLYYITRVIIPPLNRCFLLIGVDINGWFNAMPRKKTTLTNCISPDSSSKKRNISHYFTTATCIACNDQRTQQGICSDCCKVPQKAVVVLQNRMKLWDQAHHEVSTICQSCCGYPVNNNCISLDCPVLYIISKTKRDLQQIPYTQQVLTSTLNIHF